MSVFLHREKFFLSIFFTIHSAATTFFEVVKEKKTAQKSPKNGSKGLKTRLSSDLFDKRVRSFYFETNFASFPSPPRLFSLNGETKTRKREEKGAEKYLLHCGIISAVRRRKFCCTAHTILQCSKTGRIALLKKI